MLKINKFFLYFIVMGSCMNVANVNSKCMQASGCIVSDSKCGASCNICNNNKDKCANKPENKVILQVLDHGADLYVSVSIQKGAALISKDELASGIRELINNLILKHNK